MKGNSVYIVSRYNSIFGVYEDFDDATQMVKIFIEKGQPADILTQIIK